ncbi:tetratricopeptide repeat protein [Pseudoduganella sp. RAF19]|uniref:tetratricopeptide repeat protein n=1 Tax=Pseudoduganella sp. RAF19 TaxID=3233052 RepID=UPI003F9A3243
MQAYNNLSVLIIDPNQHMRAGLHNMLSQLDVRQIEHAVSSGTAIRQLDKRHYDLILCEYDLGSENGQDGQQLLEDLRHHKIISQSAMFIMLTTEGMYGKVVSAAELTPTDYILKPFTVDVLSQRIARAVDRRNALLPVHQMFEQGRLQEAIDASESAATAHPRYATECARLRAEALLALGHTEAAQGTYAEILESRDVGWAQLGLARCQFAARNFAAAVETLQTLLDANPKFMAAYDLMARAHEAMGQPDDARQVLEAAVSISPHMVRRLRHLGQVAFDTGDVAAAEKTFKQVVARAKYSEFRDPEDHVNLVRTLVKKGDASGAATVLRDLERSSRSGPNTDACRAYSAAMLQALNGNGAAAAVELANAAKALEACSGLSRGLKMGLVQSCLENGLDQEAMHLLDAFTDDAHSGINQADAEALYVKAGRSDLAHNEGDSVERYLDDLVKQAAARSGQGDQRGAIQVLKAAVKRRPDNPGLMSALASAMLRLMNDEGWDAPLAEQCAALLARLRKADPRHAMLAGLSSQYIALRTKTNQTSAISSAE